MDRAAGTRTRLVVSVHDVSPATAVETARWCADADALGVPVSLLVVPGPWRGTSLTAEPGFAQVLRARVSGGDELVLHGWAHRAGPEGAPLRRAAATLLARGAAEFAALDQPQAAWRLAAGQAVLGSLGLHAAGFTPPGWLASRAAVRALAAAGLRYTTTHLGVHDLVTGLRMPGVVFSHRPGGVGERAGVALMGLGSRVAAGRVGLIRIALHPDDLHRSGLRSASLRAVESLLAAGAHATTYGALSP